MRATARRTFATATTRLNLIAADVASQSSHLSGALGVAGRQCQRMQTATLPPSHYGHLSASTRRSLALLGFVCPSEAFAKAVGRARTKLKRVAGSCAAHAPIARSILPTPSGKLPGNNELRNGHDGRLVCIIYPLADRSRSGKQTSSLCTGTGSILPVEGEASS